MKEKEREKLRHTSILAETYMRTADQEALTITEKFHQLTITVHTCVDDHKKRHTEMDTGRK